MQWFLWYKGRTIDFEAHSQLVVEKENCVMNRGQGLVLNAKLECVTQKVSTAEEQGSSWWKKIYRPYSFTPLDINSTLQNLPDSQRFSEIFRNYQCPQYLILKSNSQTLSVILRDFFCHRCPLLTKKIIERCQVCLIDKGGYVIEWHCTQLYSLIDCIVCHTLCNLKSTKKWLVVS